MPVRRFSTAELVLTQRLHLERPLLLMVLLGAAGSALAEGNIFYLGLISAGVLVNALALWRRSEVYVPRLFVNIAVLGATGFFLLDFFETPNFFQVLGHYLILIQLCKLFERKRNRDYAQIIALSVVLVLDAALLTTGLWFALLLVAYVPVACYVAMVLTLKVSLDRQATARLAVESAPADPRRLAWNVSGRFPRRRLWGGAFGAAAICALTAVVVFLLMPRGSPGALFSLPRVAAGRERVTGFPDAFRLTQVGRITRDRRVVMHVRLESGPGEMPLAATGLRAYLRGRTYAIYHKGEWFAERGRTPWWGTRTPLAAAVLGEGGVIVQHVTMDPSLLPTTFAIAPTVHMDLPEGVRLSGLYPEMTVDTNRQDAPLEYKAYSFAQPVSARQREYLEGLRSRGAVVAARSRPGTAVAPAIGELAREWCADLLAERNRRSGGAGELHDRLDVKIARRLARRLAADYAYTLDLSQADPFRDPVEDFLFHTRRGHCQFFASAMVLMCRVVGVQARMAGGFLASEPSPAGGGYLVRASDAHAWCEVFTPSTDWLIVDPTPAEALETRPRGLRRLQDLWGTLRFFWRTRVIGYGEADRQNLFGRFLKRFQVGAWGLVRFLRRTVRAAANLLTERFSWGLLLSALPALAMALAVVSLTGLLAAVIRRRRRRPHVGVHPRLPTFYHKFVAVLWRRGHRQRPEQTAREFLAQVAQELAVGPGRLGQLADLLDQIRWGGLEPPAGELARAERTVAEIMAQLRARRRG